MGVDNGRISSGVIDSIRVGVEFRFLIRGNRGASEAFITSQYRLIHLPDAPHLCQKDCGVWGRQSSFQERVSSGRGGTARLVHLEGAVAHATLKVTGIHPRRTIGCYWYNRTIGGHPAARAAKGPGGGQHDQVCFEFADHRTGNCPIYSGKQGDHSPPAYLYVHHQVVNGVQSPPTPSSGYIHWSSYLFGSSKSESKFSSGPGGFGIVSGTPGPYGSTSGWEMFQCPLAR